MRSVRKPFSIKSRLIILFTAILLVFLAGIGTLTYLRWASSARITMQNISDTLSNSLQDQIHSFFQTPLEVNQVSHTFFEKKTVDLSDPQIRDSYFASLLSSIKGPIYSLSIGTEEGYYYGARKNVEAVVELMHNDIQTGGKSWYYALNDDFSAGQRVVEAGLFDPRTRPWYQAAVEHKAPIFSPVYKHFIMNDLTISAATPVYDKEGELEGVLGTHLLLTDLGSALADVVALFNGQAIIVEKDTGLLIANSLGLESHAVSDDGQLQRVHISKLPTLAFSLAFEEAVSQSASKSVQRGEYERYQITTQSLSYPGIDWLVLTAIPNSLLFSHVQETLVVTILLTLLAGSLAAITYQFFIEHLLKQVNALLKVSEALAAGDLTKRVNVTKDDEIGAISHSLNHVADSMQLLINNLEQQVEERTKALHQANRSLEENTLQLELLLNSTAEAIYGIDLHGKCTFCNRSTLQILGFHSIDDVLGRNMHELVHHSKADGTPLTIEECKIFHSMHQGVGIESEDEVFWKADGTSFNVSYHSFPQIREGIVVGGVVSFMDITERKRKEEQIAYLGNHDALTGLYNRSYFEKVYPLYDTSEHWPLSLIFADINGLKMTNDIFGHQAGDKLIKKAAEILKKSCSGHDMVARTGGDEFILLLTKTTREQAEKVIAAIRSGFANARIEAIKCSISLGSETKSAEGMSLEEVMANAENAMYRDKNSNRTKVQNDLINTLQETLHARSRREEEHSAAVQDLCCKLAHALGVSEAELNTISRAAYLHDIGKISLSEELLHKEQFTSDEYERMKQHPVVGFRILTLFDDTLDLAEAVYSHHERWDGSGYPRGLKGEQIPYLSRIMAVVETYDRIFNRTELPLQERSAHALKEILEASGSQFDPAVAQAFLEMMKQEQSKER